MTFPAYKNPIFSRLREHVLFENELSRKRRDLENQLFTLQAGFIFEKDQITDQLLEALSLNDFSESSSLTDIKELSLLVSLAEQHGIKIPSKITETLQYLLQDLIDSKHYPIATKSLICWIIKDLNGFEPEIKKIQQVLDDKCEEYLASYKYLQATEIAFGTDDSKALRKIVENPIQFFDHSKNWPRDKLAKAIIRLSPIKNYPLNSIVKRLEEVIESEYSSWVEPDIWLAVIESEKIVNSNMSQEEINYLLDNLKQVKKSWAQIVDKINQDGVHIRLSNILKSPSFSPIEDTLSLIALHKQNREETVQLDEEEYKNLIIHEKKKNSIPLSKKEIWNYALSIIGISFINAYTFNQIYISFKSFDKLVDAIYQYNPPNILAFIFDVFVNPYVGFIFFFWWLIRIIRLPVDTKSFTLISLFDTIPLISDVKKHLKND